MVHGSSNILSQVSSLFYEEIFIQKSFPKVGFTEVLTLLINTHIMILVENKIPTPNDCTREIILSNITVRLICKYVLHLDPVPCGICHLVSGSTVVILPRFF